MLWTTDRHPQIGFAPLTPLEWSSVALVVERSRPPDDTSDHLRRAAPAPARARTNSREAGRQGEAGVHAW
jgi:hypothetical protein